MADKKITDLSDGGAIQDADEFIVARSGANNKIAGSQVAAKAPVQSVFGRTGSVVAANGDYSGVVASSLTGATAATRYVGATTSGAPVSGSFLKGDFIITQDGHIYICTVAGTPGTWTQASGGSSSPLTTKGDVWGFSTVDARIPVGSDGTLLSADSTQSLGVKWKSAATLDTLNTVASSTSALTVNFSTAPDWDITLTANCTFTLSGAPASGTPGVLTLILRQDATGSRTITWPGSVTWISGAVPTLHTAASSVDIVQLVTVDGGTTWLGVQAAPTTTRGYLGSATSTTVFSTSSTTAVQVTGLTATVTIPSTGHTKVTVSASSIQNSSGGYVELSLWDGTVGSGTKLDQVTFQSTTASQPSPASMVWIGTPSAGSKTYNVGICNAAVSGTTQINAGATNPALLLVEQI